jgi:uncharacterized protein DUF5063
MNGVEAFATEAKQFCDWLMEGRDSGERAAHAGLVRLCRLYTAALELPDLRFTESGDSDADDVPQDEWKQAYAAAGRLPVGLYKEVYDPVGDLSEDEEPVVGDVADDLADIYRDVMRGLRAFDKGDMNNALWEWRFNLAHHWGAHATAAIRVMHMWIQTNAPSRLQQSADDASESA